MPPSPAPSPAGPLLPQLPPRALPAGPGPTHLSLLEQAPPPPGRPACLQPAAKRGREGGREGRKEGSVTRESEQGKAGPRPPRLPAAARPRLPAKMAARRGGANAALASASGKEPPRFRGVGASLAAQLTSASGRRHGGPVAAEGTGVPQRLRVIRRFLLQISRVFYSNSPCS